MKTVVCKKKGGGEKKGKQKGYHKYDAGQENEKGEEGREMMRANARLLQP